MADNDEKILKALEALQADVKDVKQGQGRLEKNQQDMRQDITILKDGQVQTNKDIAVLKNGQAHNTTMLEAVLAGQQELQKTAAREVTVMKLADRLTRKVNDHEERITDLEKEAGIPHPHKH